MSEERRIITQFENEAAAAEADVIAQELFEVIRQYDTSAFMRLGILLAVSNLLAHLVREFYKRPEERATSLEATIALIRQAVADHE